MHSLQSRLLFSTTIVLGIFLLIAAMILDQNFRNNKINHIVARLGVQIKELTVKPLNRYGQLCESPVNLSDYGFKKQSSPKIFAVVIKKNISHDRKLPDAGLIWRSESFRYIKKQKIPFTGKAVLGHIVSEVITMPDGNSYITISFLAGLGQVENCDESGIDRKEIDLGVGQDIKKELRRGASTSNEVIGMQGITPAPDKNKATATVDTKNDPVGKDAATVVPPDKTKTGKKKPLQVIDLAAKIKSEPGKGKLGSENREIMVLESSDVPAIIKISESLDRRREAYSPLKMISNLNRNTSYNEDVHNFRFLLAYGFVVVIATYLLLLAIFLRLWGLKPMRKVSEELELVKIGKEKQLAGKYPKEILSLTDSINQLIISERARQERFRNSLGDLAHSLKTPLAVLVSSSEADMQGEDWKINVKEQVERMRQIIGYQLERAASSPHMTLAGPVSVLKVVQRLSNTLQKVYADKKVNSNFAIASQVVFIGDEGDLLEMLGNLMENAYKWSENRVYISARNIDNDADSKLEVTIEDDGPGVPEDKLEHVLKRGYRADETVSGQGIGLAVVKEIIHAYSGQLAVERSNLGGAKFIIYF